MEDLIVPSALYLKYTKPVAPICGRFTNSVSSSNCLREYSAQPFRSNSNNSFCIIKNFETNILSIVLEQCTAEWFLLEINKLHLKADVGFIISIPHHCIIITHSRKIRKINVAALFENKLHHAFKHLQHIFSLYKSHFTINLCKLRLTILS